MKKRKLVTPEKKRHHLTNSHPKKGSTIKTEPIRHMKDVHAILRNLSDNPRNFCLFVCGINFALRGGDLLNLRVKDVEQVKAGGDFEIREGKTKKKRTLTISKPVYDAINSLLEVQPYFDENDYLFQSQRGGRMTIQALNALVKLWCKQISLKGQYGSHSLRKTWGYQQRVKFGTSLPVLMETLGHSSEKTTLTYLCIQKNEIRDVYLNVII